MTEDIVQSSISVIKPPTGVLVIDKNGVNLSVTDAEIAHWKEEFLPMTIAGVKDHVGFKAVNGNRIMVRKKRAEVEKHWTGIKKVVNAWKRKGDKDQKNISSALRFLEKELFAKQLPIIEEKKEIKLAREKAEKELLEKRVAALTPFNYTIDESLLKKMPEPEFNSLVVSAKMAFDANQAYLQSLEKQKQQAQKELDDLAKQKKELQNANALLQVPAAPTPEQAIAAPIAPAEVPVVSETVSPVISNADDTAPVENIQVMNDQPANVVPENKFRDALQELFDAVPGQTNDQDWWSDELRAAMQHAERILCDE